MGVCTRSHWSALHLEAANNPPDYTNKWQLLASVGTTQLTYTLGNLRIQANPNASPGSNIGLISKQIFNGDVDYSVQMNHQRYGRTNVGFWSDATNGWLAITALDTDDTKYLNFSSGSTSTEYKYAGTLHEQMDDNTNEGRRWPNQFLRGWCAEGDLHSTREHRIPLSVKRRVYFLEIRGE